MERQSVIMQVSVGRAGLFCPFVVVSTCGSLKAQEPLVQISQTLTAFFVAFSSVCGTVARDWCRLLFKHSLPPRE